MENKPENPPAFPRSQNEGMSLRDYFAAYALQAIISTPRPFIIKETGKGIKEIYEIAEQSYELADAMLKARQS